MGTEQESRGAREVGGACHEGGRSIALDRHIHLVGIAGQHVADAVLFEDEYVRRLHRLIPRLAVQRLLVLRRAHLWPCADSCWEYHLLKSSWWKSNLTRTRLFGKEEGGSTSLIR